MWNIPLLVSYVEYVFALFIDFHVYLDVRWSEITYIMHEICDAVGSP